jgi:hypothetical protein
MSRYLTSKDDFYKENFDNQLTPYENDELAFNLSKIMSKEQLGNTYSAMNNSILIIYATELAIVFFVPETIMDWCRNFFGSEPPYYFWTLFFIVLASVCLLFNKYGFIKTMKHTLEIYGRAYSYKITIEYVQSYTEYQLKKLKQKIQ